MLGRAPQIAGGGHAKRRAESGTRVTGAEAVVGALAAHEETAGPAGAAQVPEELAAPARQQLVHVALVGDVEDELVVRRIEYPMQRDGQLDHA